MATTLKPMSWKLAANWVAAGLSPSVTEMNTVPELGSSAPAAACAFPNAAGNSRATPMTSPVDFISGPISASERGKRPNGRTASFTDTCRGKRGMPSSMSARRSPSIRRHATFASDTPIALDTNGTVREARGFASITYRSSPVPWIANCMLISPTTPSPSAIALVASSTCPIISGPSDIAGITQAESPECTPASSTCCMIAPISTSSPSQSASTSISIAFSRKRSRKIVRPAFPFVRLR